MTRRGMWGVGAWVIGGLAALAAAAIAPVVESAQPDPLRRPPPSSAALRPYPADSLGRVTLSRDVFRLARRPASLAYDPQRAAAPVVVDRPPKPRLALLGLIAGAEATAVIEGLPGVEGARVVRVGDQVSGVRVVRIGADHVRLAGMDTVWVLRVREPWQ
jgi:hypothetical protein